jgi:hypothetical protein
MMVLFLFLPFVYDNYQRARKAGLHATGWAALTVVLMLATLFVGGIIEALVLIAQYPELSVLASKGQGASQELMEYVEGIDQTVPSIVLLLSLMGGYLIARYILTKKDPGPKNLV